MMNIKFKISEKNLVCLGMTGIFLHGTIRDFISVLSIVVLGKELLVINSIIYYVSFFAFLLGLLSLLKKSSLFILLSLSILSLVWVFSLNYNSSVEVYIINNWQNFFFSILPFSWIFYYLFKCNRTPEFNINFLSKLGFIRLQLCLISQLLMFIFPRSDIYSDYMTASYALLVPTIFCCMILFFKNHKYKTLIIIEQIISLSFILVLGCRGALICLIGFYLCALFFVRSNNYRSPRFIILLLALLLLLLLQPICQLLVMCGATSRPIILLANNSLLFDENRSIIFQTSINAINARPFGYGVMGDRSIISGIGIWEVHYCHNIILELGIDFGYFGILLFVCFLINFVTAYKKTCLGNKIILIGLLSISILKLMFSSTIWNEQFLWALIGAVFGSLKGASSYDKRDNSYIWKTRKFKKSY